jgi:hypothetical protein
MPNHPHRRWLGPGIVTGAADDPSGIGTYSQVGAALLVAVANTFNIGADIGSMAAGMGSGVGVMFAIMMAALSVLAALP